MNVWKLNGEYLTPEDEKQDKLYDFYQDFCSNCYFQHVCKKAELLDQDKCGFKPTHKTVWRLIDPANGTCTQCKTYIINDSGFCPDCHGVTKKQWRQIKIKISRYHKS